MKYLFFKCSELLNRESHIGQTHLKITTRTVAIYLSATTFIYKRLINAPEGAMGIILCNRLLKIRLSSSNPDRYLILYFIWNDCGLMKLGWVSTLGELCMDPSPPATASKKVTARMAGLESAPPMFSTKLKENWPKTVQVSGFVQFLFQMLICQGLVVNKGR